MRLQIFFSLKSCILLPLAMAVLLSEGCRKAAESTIYTAAGEHRKAKLPNGVEVVLNAESTLAFSASTWDAHPEVELEGEAFFKTPKNKRFSILSEQGHVDVVYGTFNVYAREELLEVQCVQGRVQVLNPVGTEKVLLASSEQVSVSNGRMQQRRGLTHSPAWFNGHSVFRDAPVKRVLAEIGRQYGKQMEIDSVTGNFSGKFDHKNLEKALTSVCRKTGLKYSVKGDTVRIRQ